MKGSGNFSRGSRKRVTLHRMPPQGYGPGRVVYGGATSRVAQKANQSNQKVAPAIPQVPSRTWWKLVTWVQVLLGWW